MKLSKRGRKRRFFLIVITLLIAWVVISPSSADRADNLKERIEEIKASDFADFESQAEEIIKEEIGSFNTSMVAVIRQPSFDKASVTILEDFDGKSKVYHHIVIDLP